MAADTLRSFIDTHAPTLIETVRANGGSMPYPALMAEATALVVAHGPFTTSEVRRRLLATDLVARFSHSSTRKAGPDGVSVWTLKRGV